MEPGQAGPQGQSGVYVQPVCVQDPGPEGRFRGCGPGGHPLSGQPGQPAQGRGLLLPGDNLDSQGGKAADPGPQGRLV